MHALVVAVEAFRLSLDTLVQMLFYFYTEQAQLFRIHPHQVFRFSLDHSIECLCTHSYLTPF